MAEPTGVRTVAIVASADIVVARQLGRELAMDLGFSFLEATFIATAISELARNMVLYAKGGQIRIQHVENGMDQGVMITAEDNGPGIQDLRRALVGGYSTSGGLGLGLSGVRRLMDDLDVRTDPGIGTTVTAKKWLR